MSTSSSNRGNPTGFRKGLHWPAGYESIARIMGCPNEAELRDSPVIRALSRKSTYVWHEAWSLAGTEALLSKGPGGQSCRLSDGQMQRLEPAGAASARG
jgi:hypothetical protein